MAEEKHKPFRRTLRGYVEFEGTITCKTGLLIGGENVAVEIGGIDRSVIRDPATGKPYIPGSSLKGKLRALMEKMLGLESQRRIEPGFRHECDDILEALECPLCRLFGSTAKGEQEEGNRNLPAALIVRDCLMETGAVPKMEYKMENTLDRLTAAATPRLFERVAPGEHFVLNILLRMEDVSFSPDQAQAGAAAGAAGKQTGAEEKQKNQDSRLREDLWNLLTALRNLEYEGLGGNVSRGYGRVKIELKPVNIIDQWGVKIRDVPEAKGSVADLAEPQEKLAEVCKKFSVPPRKEPPRKPNRETSLDVKS